MRIYQFNFVFLKNRNTPAVFFNYLRYLRIKLLVVFFGTNKIWFDYMQIVGKKDKNPTITGLSSEIFLS